MKKTTYIFLILTMVILGNSCQKKSLIVKIQESACKTFKISNPSSVLLTTITCGSLPLVWDAKVTINYDGKQDCIYKIIIDSKVLNTANVSMTNVSCTGSWLLTDPGVVITSTTITFPYKMIFANQVDVNSYLGTVAKIHVEDEYGAKSNEVQTLIASNGCTTPSVSYTTFTSNISITFDDVDDGDLPDDDVHVTIYLNGNLMANNVKVTSKTQSFLMTVLNGSNNLTVYQTNPEGENVHMYINGNDVINTTGLYGVNVNF